MDNVLSWVILFVVANYGLIRFALVALEEDVRRKELSKRE